MSWDDDDFEPDLSGGGGGTADDGVGEDDGGGGGGASGDGNDDADTAGWFGTRDPAVVAAGAGAADVGGGAEKEADDRPPLLLIDFTVLSGGALHNKQDPTACNDPDMKRELTKACTADFVKYRDGTALIEAGTVRSCGHTVWRAALKELRVEHPGHFWAPIFPPRE
jgi:hypothetical protein